MKINKQQKLIFYTLSIFLAICFLLLSVSLLEGLFLQKDSSTQAAGACPGGYTYVDAGDFCIEEDLHDAGSPLSWADAAMACVSDDAARLCRSSEWAQACMLHEAGTISLQNVRSQWEWIDDLNMQDTAVVAGETDCDDYDHENRLGNQNEYRCCKNGVD